MNFKDVSIALSYKSVGEDSFSKILNPLLKYTLNYKRSVGFFSSSAFDFIGSGITQLARNGGHIYLATSPKLNETDIQAIKMGYELREVLKDRFISEVSDALMNITDQNAIILSELIKEKVLDIKIVLKDGGMYHDKLALLEDFEGNKIACVGSNNESGNGYCNNYEKVRVYKSWNDAEGRVEDETEEFESIWSNSNEFLQVFSFMDAFEEKVIERIKTGNSLKKDKVNKYNMREYQIQAKESWVKNGYRGFFVMATGTGKTITSLNSIKELIISNKIFTVIAVPYKHLVNQWYDDVKEFYPDAHIFLVHGEVSGVEEKIYASYISSSKSYKPIIVITTIKSFFLKKYANLYNKISYEKLLIVDEAHNFYNSLSDELSLQYKYKLGLSATPVFGNDETKTKVLVDWFGGVVFDFPIEKAIGKYLVNYDYHPIFVSATQEDEDKFQKGTMMMLSAIDSKSNKIVDETKFTLGYRARLRAISMAEEKLINIDNIFNQIDDTDHTIIYCSDGRLYYENKKSGINEELRHLEYILKLINNSLLNKCSNLKASKFTATEDVQTRMSLINEFNKGEINYLVAIRCLDEGINIPSIKTALILSSNDNYREFVQRRGRILRTYKDPISLKEKEKASIYDIIVLPSIDNKSFAEIEFRRFYEYSRLALNKDELMFILENKLEEYSLSVDDIKFKNEYITGGDLDD